jgi:hypothetical protein
MYGKENLKYFTAAIIVANATKNYRPLNSSPHDGSECADIQINHAVLTTFNYKVTV